MTITSFLTIGLGDVSLSFSAKNHFDAAVISILVILYIISFAIFQKNYKNLYVPLVTLLVALIGLSAMHFKDNYETGSYFYFFPVATGYFASTFDLRTKAKYKYFFAFSSATLAFIILKYFFWSNSSVWADGAQVALFTYRLVASIILSSLLISLNAITNTPAVKVKEGTNFLDALFHSNFDAYILMDKETLEVKEYNKSMAEMFNLPETQSLCGLYISQVLMRYLAADSPNLDLLMNNIPEKWDGAAFFLTYTKKRLETYVRSFPFVKDGKKYLLLVIRNTSEISNAKEKLAIYKEKMEKAAKAKARFLSSMSHELRTPLNGIIGTSNLILSEKDVPENIINHVNILLYSSEHMLGIINDILDFSKIDAGKLELKRNMFNLKDSLEKLTKSFANEFKSKNIEFLFSHDLRIGRMNVIGDQVKLNQVIANLLSNALKFTIAGSVILNITIENLSVNQITLSFEVKDTGIGILKENQETIFQDFVQVDNGDARSFDGTGLGLTISEKLVEIFGGKLEVESELQKGSRFYFTISLDIAPEKQVIKKEFINNTIQPDIRGVRVLIVEDNEINAGILKSFLLKWKIRIMEARNGIQALELLKYHKFDLILMDLEMPEMNGYAALKKIRETDTKTPVIAFTAALLENMDSLINESGFNDYVLKPFRPSDLKQKIEYYAPHRKIDYA